MNPISAFTVSGGAIRYFPPTTSTHLKIMEAPLTFGEYIHRLRRAREWDLRTLSENCGISCIDLSGLENESEPPTVGSVVSLARALDGDIKYMLEMTHCLPQVFLDHLSAHEETAEDSSLRVAGPSEGEPDPAAPAPDHGLAEQLKEYYRLDDDQAEALALAIDGLANLERQQRESLFTLISSIAD